MIGLGISTKIGMEGAGDCAMNYMRKLVAMMAVVGQLFSVTPVILEAYSLFPVNTWQQTELDTQSEQQVFGETDDIQALSSNAYKVICNAQGLPIQITAGGQDLVRYQYDDAGEIQKISYANGDVISYERILPGLSTNVYLNSQSIPVWSIDETAYGTVRCVADRVSQRETVFTYDSAERMEELEETQNGRVIKRVLFSFDENERISSVLYQLSPNGNEELGPPREFRFYYKDDSMEANVLILPGGMTLYDSYEDGKLMERTLQGGNTPIMVSQYCYSDDDPSMPGSLTVMGPDGALMAKYRCKTEKSGRVQSYSGELDCSYAYDEKGQLLNESCGEKAIQYEYDPFGNLRKRENGEILDVLLYENENRPDLLTAYNGNTIQYDPLGNPLAWLDGTKFTWECGTRLASAVNTENGLEIRCTYDYQGTRISKTVNGLKHTFLWQDGRLLSEQFGRITLEFYYDQSGMPYALLFKGGENDIGRILYFVVDLQGNVTQLLDENGRLVGRYTYNAWGDITSISGEYAGLNPLRYRGWYYDTDLKLYYVDGRYYAPEICRYINPGDFSAILENPELSPYIFSKNDPVNIPKVGEGKRREWNGPSEEQQVLVDAMNTDYDTEKHLELSYDQKVFVSTIYAEATSTAQGYYVSPLARQAIANVIMNRIGQREWTKYKTAAEICAYTGFTAYGNYYYEECMDYLNAQDGSNELIEEILAEVLPVYTHELPDITGGAQIFYTPAAMHPGRSLGWNSALLEEVIISGVDPYYEARFFRYK